jgi:signal transduction histidine kinase
MGRFGPRFLGSRELRLIGGAAAAAYAVAVVLALPEPGLNTPVTAYSMASTGAHAADLLAGLGLVGAGLFMWIERPGGRLGLLAMLAGVAWFAPDWIGWEEGPAIVRSLAMIAAPFAFVFLFHLVLAFPSGRLGSRFARAATLALYAVALAVAIGRALFYDPFLDPYCWGNCTDNSFLVHSDQGLAQTLDDVWLGAALAAAAVLVTVNVWRLARATRPALRTLWTVLVPGLFVAGAEAAYAVAQINDRFEDPTDSVFASVFVARASATIALAVGLAWSVLAARRTRTTVSRLAAELGDAPSPGSLRTALAATVGDSELEVAYWLADSDRYVDAQGATIVPSAPSSGRVRTPVVRAGRRVAILVHDEAALDAAELETEVGPAARLAIDNERLQAEALAQLHDLRASRARIVETGDEERRRLERDLHDAAQQRLLALTYGLRRARSEAEAEGEPELGSALDSALREAHEALADLRDLAHGIYPAILTEAGLGPALETVADGSPLPVELDVRTDERFPTPVETAAYLVAAESVEGADGRGADHLALRVTREDDELVVEVNGAVADPAVHLTDRVGALGGRIVVGADRIRAEIPCA